MGTICSKFGRKIELETNEEKKKKGIKTVRTVRECIKNSHGCEEEVAQHHAPLSKEEETFQF